jgi:DUF1009 family protein
MEKTIGLIAGSRTLPFLFAREARAGGFKVVAVGFEGETNPDLAAYVDEIVWVRVGQLSRMIEAFTHRGVRECVMLGQVAPKNLFDLRPDLRAMSLMFRLKEKNAHSIFGAIGDELAKDGVRLIEPLAWLKPWIPGSDFSVGPRLSSNQRDDLQFGLKLAQETSRLEIGQTVVVKNGTALAVEAFEGTDACLERGGRLASKGGAVAVKVAKPGHDMRFDIPCIGPKTVEVCGNHGVAVLAVEAGRSLLLDRDELEQIATRLKVSVVTF